MMTQRSGETIASIICFTYNQKDYIRQCLDSLVAQQTTFGYRVIIHDDASTDGTTDIVREYAARYPDVVIPVIETENQYSLRERGDMFGAMRPYIDASRYIAFCEGDDYWTDTQKLQRQVSLMEDDPDCTLCFHDVTELHDKTGECRLHDYYGRKIPETSDLKAMVQIGYTICTCSACYRREALALDQLKLLPPIMGRDILLQYFAAMKGHVRHIAQSMAVYRLGSGVWAGTDRDDTWHFAQILRNLSTIQMLLPTMELKLEIEKQIRWHIDCQVAREKEAERYTHSLEQGRARRIGLAVLWPFRQCRQWLSALTHSTQQS